MVIKKDTLNYKSISLLTFVSKIFEKTMYNHLISFVDKEDISNKCQFGFVSRILLIMPLYIR